MDEIVPNLWIGDLRSALDADTLHKHNIQSILTAMRGRVTILDTFTHFQVELDDTEEADVLAFFPQCISFIESELEKGRGVLVHCQAGVSRSCTIVVAYLMYAQNLDAEAALNNVKAARPCSFPNEGFLMQLDVFYKASYKVSRRDKATRMFYLERAVDEVLNGDGSPLETDMFAKYPRTPSDSAPATPGGPRRRIRCKMCRQELATREHMLDHGQVGPATPRSAALTPAASRRSSMTATAAAADAPRSRHSSSGALQLLPRSRLGSSSDTAGGDMVLRRLSLLGLDGRPLLRGLSEGTGMSALETDDDDAAADDAGAAAGDKPAAGDGHALENGAAPVHALVRSTSAGQGQGAAAHDNAHDLAAQLAALRSPHLGGLHGLAPFTKIAAPHASAPLLMNAKCSGYFVEPMKWMEPFLAQGQMAGKIVCPNRKCGAKLGNYDWAGVCCSCKEWVTPGFCIHRSKVDEVI